MPPAARTSSMGSVAPLRMNSGAAAAPGPGRIRHPQANLADFVADLPSVGPVAEVRLVWIARRARECGSGQAWSGECEKRQEMPCVWKRVMDRPERRNGHVEPAGA